MRVETPVPPLWYRVTQAPRQLPYTYCLPLLTPLGFGLMVGATVPEVMFPVGVFIIWAYALLVVVVVVGQFFGRRWARGYFDSAEGKAAVAAAEAQAAAEAEATRAADAETIDWLTATANGEASPFAKLGFDSEVGMLVVIRRDQRVPGHDKWIAQLVVNQNLTDPLPLDVAAIHLHDVSHAVHDAHEEQTAGTIEVPTQR